MMNVYSCKIIKHVKLITNKNELVWNFSMISESVSGLIDRKPVMADGGCNQKGRLKF